jgi:hypothetical protein
MEIEKFRMRLEKLNKSNPNFEYKFGEKLNSNDFDFIEKKLNINFPEKIKEFYQFTNGLKTLNPNFEIIELDKLTSKNSLIHFATFDKTKKICFMTEKLNNAKEWTIIEKESKYELTLTISSFWSNKIWHWLEKKNKIWENEFWKNE